MRDACLAPLVNSVRVGRHLPHRQRRTGEVRLERGCYLPRADREPEIHHERVDEFAGLQCVGLGGRGAEGRLGGGADYITRTRHFVLRMSPHKCATLMPCPPAMSTLIELSETPDRMQTPPTASEVVRHLAHELRQPLSAIESIAFCLAAGNSVQTPGIDEHVDRLQQLVEHANWVLADMVHLLQLSAPQPVVCDCNAVLEEVLEEAWAGEGLEIFYEPDPALPRTKADPEQLRHLFRSLLQFISRFAEDPRQVYLATESAGSFIVTSATAAMESVKLDTLFEPLAPQQVFTCRLIAERNGGRFTAFRDESGQLCLRCELPAAAV